MQRVGALVFVLVLAVLVLVADARVVRQLEALQAKARDKVSVSAGAGVSGDASQPLFILGEDTAGRSAFARKLGIPTVNQFDFTDAKAVKYLGGKKLTLTYPKSFSGLKLSDANFNGVVIVNSHSNLRNNIMLGDRESAGGKTFANTLLSIEENTGIDITKVVVFSCNLGKSHKFMSSMAETLNKHLNPVHPPIPVFITRFINNRFAGGLQFLYECCDTTLDNTVESYVVSSIADVEDSVLTNALVTKPRKLAGEHFFSHFVASAGARADVPLGEDTDMMEEEDE